MRALSEQEASRLARGEANGTPVSHPGHGVIRCPHCLGHVRHEPNCEYRDGRCVW